VTGHREHTVLEQGVDLIRHGIEEFGHGTVLHRSVGDKTADMVVLGRLDELLQYDLLEPPAPPFPGHGKSDFCNVRCWIQGIPSKADDIAETEFSDHGYNRHIMHVIDFIH